MRDPKKLAKLRDIKTAPIGPPVEKSGLRQEFIHISLPFLKDLAFDHPFLAPSKELLHQVYEDFQDGMYSELFRPRKTSVLVEGSHDQIREIRTVRNRQPHVLEGRIDVA